MIQITDQAARSLLKNMGIGLADHEILARKAINSHIDSPARLKALQAWSQVGGKPAAKSQKSTKPVKAKTPKE